MPNSPIVTCAICGKPYRWYAFTTADQSACPECVAAAERGVERPSSDVERKRRRAAFGED